MLKVAQTSFAVLVSKIFTGVQVILAPSPLDKQQLAGNHCTTVW